MSVTGFHKKKSLDGFVSSIQVFFGFLEFFNGARCIGERLYQVHRPAQHALNQTIGSPV